LLVMQSKISVSVSALMCRATVYESVDCQQDALAGTDIDRQ
jgi:hypothetical protein